MDSQKTWELVCSVFTDHLSKFVLQIFQLSRDIEHISALWTLNKNDDSHTINRLCSIVEALNKQLEETRENRER